MTGKKESNKRNTGASQNSQNRSSGGKMGSTVKPSSVKPQNQTSSGDQKNPNSKRS